MLVGSNVAVARKRVTVRGGNVPAFPPRATRTSDHSKAFMIDLCKRRTD
jgi:hypothetical protein